MIDDLRDHGRGPGFFTIVASTCVLGSQSILIVKNVQIVWLLFACGLLFWLLVMYSFFTATIIRAQKPSLEAGINGAWLIASVATQSVSVLRRARNQTLLSLCGSLRVCVFAVQSLPLFFSQRALSAP